MKDSPKAVTVLLRASQSVSRLLENDIASYGLNTTEFGTLEYLYHKGKQPIHMICDKLLMANSSMTYVVDQLESKGWVERKKDKIDRRKIVIDLTEAGKVKIASIFPQHQKLLDEVFDVLTEEELNTMVGLLKRVGLRGKNISTIYKE